MNFCEKEQRDLTNILTRLNLFRLTDCGTSVCNGYANKCLVPGWQTNSLNNELQALTAVSGH